MAGMVHTGRRRARQFGRSGVSHARRGLGWVRVPKLWLRCSTHVVDLRSGADTESPYPPRRLALHSNDLLNA